MFVCVAHVSILLFCRPQAECVINTCRPFLTPTTGTVGIPVSNIFSLDVESEQADARRDSRTKLRRANSSAKTERGKFYLPVQLTMRRIDN